MKTLRPLLQKLAAIATAIIAPFDLRDLHAYVGIVSIFIGLALAYLPAAFALCGLLIFWLGVRR